MKDSTISIKELVQLAKQCHKASNANEATGQFIARLTGILGVRNCGDEADEIAIALKMSYMTRQESNIN